MLYYPAQKLRSTSLACMDLEGREGWREGDGRRVVFSFVHMALPRILGGTPLAWTGGKEGGKEGRKVWNEGK